AWPRVADGRLADRALVLQKEGVLPTECSCGPAGGRLVLHVGFPLGHALRQKFPTFPTGGATRWGRRVPPVHTTKRFSDLPATTRPQWSKLASKDRARSRGVLKMLKSLPVLAAGALALLVVSSTFDAADARGRGGGGGGGRGC